MQVPQVTEEVAIAVLDLYPTLLSLARAYSRLEGDVDAQEKMLKTQSYNVVNAGLGPLQVVIDERLEGGGRKFGGGRSANWVGSVRSRTRVFLGV
ncbi:hypothetical protein TB2_040165 [Malus domestica]